MGCQPVAPAELPSGAAPGVAVEGVAGGTKQFIWGTGSDAVDLRLVSYYASGDEVLADVSVRGQPAKVYRIGPAPQSGIGLSWNQPDGCGYTVFLPEGSSSQEVAEYAGRF